MNIPSLSENGLPVAYKDIDINKLETSIAWHLSFDDIHHKEAANNLQLLLNHIKTNRQEIKQIDIEKIRKQITHTLATNTLVKFMKPMLKNMQSKGKVDFEKLLNRLPDMLVELASTENGLEILKDVGLWDEIKKD